MNATKFWTRPPAPLHLRPRALIVCASALFIGTTAWSTAWFSALFGCGGVATLQISNKCSVSVESIRKSRISLTLFSCVIGKYLSKKLLIFLVRVGARKEIWSMMFATASLGS
ncbi:hypothetical protein Y032_0169g211 [Ancylostoma ceylanicum]|uniref:Uncharacterized protein n=1 Tax=Ancylostoma ceylanicum TaxID=53326 RepID=A0A016SVT4_9BILA|nr:hypothetical protein Y032_0169g211 [Ancylostoma ceylanicum]